MQSLLHAVRHPILTHLCASVPLCLCVKRRFKKGKEDQTLLYNA